MYVSRAIPSSFIEDKEVIVWVKQPFKPGMPTSMSTRLKMTCQKNKRTRTGYKLCIQEARLVDREEMRADQRLPLALHGKLGRSNEVMVDNGPMTLKRGREKIELGYITSIEILP